MVERCFNGQPLPLRSSLLCLVRVGREVCVVVYHVQLAVVLDVAVHGCIWHVTIALLVHTNVVVWVCGVAQVL